MNRNETMHEITVEAVTENLEQVTQFTDAFLEQIGCPMKVQIQIDIVIDELFSNIAHYAYAPGTGAATVRIEAAENPEAVVLTFLDRGVPYNPLEKEDPDITLSAEQRDIGGLGIYMVKKTMDELSYTYQDGQNILTVKKMLRK